MFSVGLQSSVVCNGVAKLGVTASGRLGALCSPTTSSSSSMSPTQDPYAFLDTPSQSPSCLYSPLKLSGSGDQYKNGHLKFTNGDIKKSRKSSIGLNQEIVKTLGSKVNQSQTNLCAVTSIVHDNSLISKEQIVNHNNVSNVNISATYNNIVIKNELPGDPETSTNVVMKCEVDSDVKYLNRTYNIPSVQQNVNNNTTPQRKLPSGKPHPSQYQSRAAKPNRRAPGLHEALQRTGAVKSTVSLSKEVRGGQQHQPPPPLRDDQWHAPGAYAFDYDLCTVQRQDRGRTEGLTGSGIGGGRCSQRIWFSSHLQQASEASVAIGLAAGGMMSAGRQRVPRDLRLSLRRALFRRQAEQETAALRCALQESAERHAADGGALRGGVLAAKRALLQMVRQRREEARERNGGGSRLLSAQRCAAAAEEGCVSPALPCAPYCGRHVARCTEQQLFRHCTAKFADNTQCSVPVFDVSHELPLCREHALKRDNYNKMNAESKPKKTPRKKAKPSAMIRPQKRNKKKKRSPTKSSPTPAPIFEETVPQFEENEFTEVAACETSSACESSEDAGGVSELAEALSETELPGQDQIVEQVLSFAPEIASRLLEEPDFTNVLNQIPPDAFNDLFAVEQEGQYEPNMEETEELERALEAVDEEVKSLEKLTSAHNMLMDGLLDDRCIAETLAQLG